MMFFLFFKNHFLDQYIKTIQNIKKNILIFSYFFLNFLETGLTSVIEKMRFDYCSLFYLYMHGKKIFKYLQKLLSQVIK
jgi:hypothetical protein